LATVVARCRHFARKPHADRLLVFWECVNQYRRRRTRSGAVGGCSLPLCRDDRVVDSKVDICERPGRRELTDLVARN